MIAITLLFLAAQTARVDLYAAAGQTPEQVCESMSRYFGLRYMLRGGAGEKEVILYDNPGVGATYFYVVGAVPVK